MSEQFTPLQLAGAVIREIIFAPSRSFRISVLRAPPTDRERQVSTQYDLHFPSVLCCWLNFQAEPWLEITSYDLLLSSDYLERYVQQTGEAGRQSTEAPSKIRHFQFTLEEGYIDIISEHNPRVFAWEMPHLGRASGKAETDTVQIEPGKGLHDESELTCAFCGKSQSEVAKIMKGPAANICDECIATCSRLITESNNE